MPMLTFLHFPFWELVGNISWKCPLDVWIVSMAWTLLSVPPELVRTR